MSEEEEIQLYKRVIELIRKQDFGKAAILHGILSSKRFGRSSVIFDELSEYDIQWYRDIGLDVEVVNRANVIIVYF